MNSFLIGLVGLIYLAIAIKYFWSGVPGLGIVFLGYAFSNVGLYMVGGGV